MILRNWGKLFWINKPGSYIAIQESEANVKFSYGFSITQRCGAPHPSQVRQLICRKKDRHAQGHKTLTRNLRAYLTGLNF